MNAQEDAHRLSRAFFRDQSRNPDLLPYIGPEGSLQRFLNGELVTHEDIIADESLLTVQALLPAQMKRLRWMLDHSTKTSPPSAGS